MITLYGFRKIFPEGIGETKDLRVQWALEESGLPYKFHSLDHTAGDLDTEAYGKLNPFRQVPVLDDDGYAITESAACVLYVAEKSGALIPGDFQGRLRVTQWCFAAVASVEPTLSTQDVLHIFGNKDEKLEDEVGKLAKRWLGGVETRLEGRTWVATDEFSAADIMLTGVLRTIRKTDLLKTFPNLTAHYARCCARPAWQKTLELSAKRLGVTVEQIR